MFNGLVDNKDRSILFSTGPQVIMHAMKKVPDMVVSLPAEKFAPLWGDEFHNINWDGVGHIQEISDPSIYSRHHGSGVWT